VPHAAQAHHRVDRSANADGNLDLSADAESRSAAANFGDCYCKSITKHVERRRAAGLSVPEAMNMQPDIDID
jgi:hypothetical protein